MRAGIPEHGCQGSAVFVFQDLDTSCFNHIKSHWLFLSQLSLYTSISRLSWKCVLWKGLAVISAFKELKANSKLTLIIKGENFWWKGKKKKIRANTVVVV